LHATKSVECARTKLFAHGEYSLANGHG